MLGKRIIQPAAHKHFNWPQPDAKARVGLTGLRKWSCKCIAGPEAGAARRNAKEEIIQGFHRAGQQLTTLLAERGKLQLAKVAVSTTTCIRFLSGLSTGDRGNVWLPACMESLTPAVAKADEEEHANSREHTNTIRKQTLLRSFYSIISWAGWLQSPAMTPGVRDTEISRTVPSLKTQKAFE